MLIETVRWGVGKHIWELTGPRMAITMHVSLSSYNIPTQLIAMIRSVLVHFVAPLHLLYLHTQTIYRNLSYAPSTHSVDCLDYPCRVRYRHSQLNYVILFHDV